MTDTETLTPAESALVHADEDGLLAESALLHADVALRPALEAVLMVADQPMDDLTLAAAVGHPADDVRAALAELSAEYAKQGRGFELRNVAGGWRF